MPLNSTRGAGSAKGFGLTAGGSPVYDFLLVVAGGGGGGFDAAGGGGAGGFRIITGTKIQSGSYPIVIGAGGTSGGPTVTSGVDSSALGFTSTGGGRGGGLSSDSATGGSGGGSVTRPPVSPVGGAGKAGNTPPTSPPQGNPGGNASPSPNGLGGAGGGGAGEPGYDFGQPGCRGNCAAGRGGDGSPVTTYFGSAPQPFYTADQPRNGQTASGYFAGGGNGAQRAANNGTGTNTPTQLGGNGFSQEFDSSPTFGNPPSGPGCSTAGVVNSGGGGGGGTGNTPTLGSAGGSGRVLIRFPASLGPKISVSPPSNTTVSNPLGLIANFTVTGTLTIS